MCGSLFNRTCLWPSGTSVDFETYFHFRNKKVTKQVLNEYQMSHGSDFYCFMVSLLWKTGLWIRFNWWNGEFKMIIIYIIFGFEALNKKTKTNEILKPGIGKIQNLSLKSNMNSKKKFYDVVSCFSVCIWFITRPRQQNGYSMARVGNSR